MLRATSQINFTRNKLTDCIIRHKVRNLRAKVRSLLPTSVCCKYNQRNKKICEMQQNLKQSRKLKLPQNWSMNKSMTEQWFYEPVGKQNFTHMFYKLTQAQIEQIEEDKIYYIGAQNITLFQEYIQNKENQRALKTSINFRSKAFIKDNNIIQYKPKSKQLKHRSNISEIFVNNQLKPKKEFSTEVKHRKRQIIARIQDQNQRNKIIVLQKMQKAQANTESIKKANFLRYKDRSKQYEKKRKKALITKMTNEKKGELVDLTQRLRRMFLSRKKIDCQNNQTHL